MHTIERGRDCFKDMGLSSKNSGEPRESMGERAKFYPLLQIKEKARRKKRPKFSSG
jgi:hypothetical protein